MDEAGHHNGGQFYSKLKNHVCHLPDQVLSFFGYKPAPLRANCVHLHEKHPEMFPTPQDVQAVIDWTFTRPDVAYPAHGPDGYFSVVRKGPGNHHAVVDLRSESGQYSVKHLTVIDDKQLAHHLQNADTARVWRRMQ